MRWPLLVFGFAPLVWTQSRTPAFEVASIRPVGPGEQSAFNSGMTIDGGLIRIGGLSLQSVTLEAYQIKKSQPV
jgi:uncharacterized protein (TIGR03435 family)